MSFGYSPLEPPLIENFSLDVAPGQWVALVGASGSGKSTMGKLITGLYEPRSGESASTATRCGAWGRERLSHIVAVGRPGHPPVQRHDPRQRHPVGRHRRIRRLLAAIDDAGLTEAVTALPGNFEAPSRKAAAISTAASASASRSRARWSSEPAILVLDEATSALDAVSEDEILTAVRRRGMTCILVAHRLSTIRDCDEIIVLERGKVVERGTHAA